MCPNILHGFTDNIFIFDFWLQTYNIHSKGVHDKGSQIYFYIHVLQSLKVTAVKHVFKQEQRHKVINVLLPIKENHAHLENKCKEEDSKLRQTGSKGHRNRERESQKGEAETGSLTWGDTYFEGRKGSEEQRFHYPLYLPENNQP